MADKILAIVRKTMLHENALKRLAFRPETGEASLELLQPDERFEYPDHELLLTFSGVASLVIERSGEGDGEDVMRIECERAERGHVARIVLGDRDRERWSIRLVFADLVYKRGGSVF